MRRDVLLAHLILSGTLSGACARFPAKEAPAMTTTTTTTDTRSNRHEAMLLDAKGSGEPIVLVGGGLTGWASWVPIQERLARERRAIRAQLLSVQYGLEDRRLPEGYGVRYESDALAAALDAQGLTAPLDLVAWSFGAEISLDFALGHPERVRTLTLIEPPAFWVLSATGKSDAQTNEEEQAMRAQREGMKDDVSEDQLATFAHQAAFVPPDRDPRTMPQWPVWVKHRRSLRNGGAEWKHTDTAERLRAFDKPVLLVKGTGSSHFLHQIVAGLAETLPRAQVVELPGGHAPQIVAEGAFLEEIGRFQTR